MLYERALEVLERRVLLATVPTGFATPPLVGGGFTNGTAMAFLPDGAILAARQTGQLNVIRQNTLLSTPYISFTVDSTGERGLLGVAVDPDYESNRHIYLYYTVPSTPRHNRISRFTTDPANPNLVQANSELVLMNLEPLTATNHNGGAMHFGLDGKLYIGVGENAVPSNAQTLSNRLGKMLRINKDGTIPTDNPFYGTATGANRAIWALGLRNPFTFAFDLLDGTMHINDVGQNSWEEINVGVAGANYGWPTIEGMRTTQTPPANYHDPLFAYAHTGDAATTGAAITGGSFYRPPPGTGGAFPASYNGDYFFSDMGNGWMRYLDDNTPNASSFASALNGNVDIQLGYDGSLYYLQRSSTAGVYRVRFNESIDPTVASRVFIADPGVSATGPHVRHVFSEYVGDTLAPADVTVQNLTTGQTIPTADLRIDYSAASHTARLRFPGLPNAMLSDGRYRVTLSAAGILDNSGNALTPIAPFEFVVLAGDADGSGAVGTADFDRVALNFNQSGKTYGQGDFNYDGNVNALDFNALAANFGKSASQFVTPLSVKAAAPLPALHDLFSTKAVGDDFEADDEAPESY